MTLRCDTAKILSEAELFTALCELPGWSVKNGRLHLELKFKNFSETFAFMTRLALLSEKLNHHPDWSNSFNKLTIDLWTHSLNAITELDIEWAGKASKCAAL